MAQDGIHADSISGPFGHFGANEVTPERLIIDLHRQIDPRFDHDIDPYSFIPQLGSLPAAILALKSRAPAPREPGDNMNYVDTVFTILDFLTGDQDEHNSFEAQDAKIALDITMALLARFPDTAHRLSRLLADTSVFDRTSHEAAYLNVKTHVDMASYNLMETDIGQRAASRQLP